jgi:hypothetical protein
MSALDKLNDVRTLWEVARAIGALSPEDRELTFTEYCERYRVSPSAGRRHWVDELWSVLDDIEREQLHRMPLPVDSSDLMYAALTNKGTVADVLVKDGAYFIETAASADVWRAPTCVVCGKELVQAVTGRPRQFCSAACKQKSVRRRARARI